MSASETLERGLVLGWVGVGGTVGRCVPISLGRAHSGGQSVRKENVVVLQAAAGVGERGAGKQRRLSKGAQGTRGACVRASLSSKVG